MCVYIFFLCFRGRNDEYICVIIIMIIIVSQHGIYNAEDKYQRLEEMPFKSETKTMSVKVKNKKVCCSNCIVLLFK